MRIESKSEISPKQPLRILDQNQWYYVLDRSNLYSTSHGWLRMQFVPLRLVAIASSVVSSSLSCRMISHNWGWRCKREGEKAYFLVYFVGAFTLPIGLHHFTLTIRTASSLLPSASGSAFVQMIAADVAASPMYFGRSMISNAHDVDLNLDPGRFSIDPEQTTFDASVSDEWNVDSLDVSSTVLEVGLQLLLPSVQSGWFSNSPWKETDDRRLAQFSSSCIQNSFSMSWSDPFCSWKRANDRCSLGTGLKYVGATLSVKSSLIILADSLPSNQTYQFMVMITDRHNLGRQATGYLLLRVVDTRPQQISVG